MTRSFYMYKLNRPLNQKLMSWANSVWSPTEQNNLYNKKWYFNKQKINAKPQSTKLGYKLTVCSSSSILIFWSYNHHWNIYDKMEGTFVLK